MHKTQAELKEEVDLAKQKVHVDGIYSHYKRPNETYRVVHLGFTEADDSLCVIYQAQYGERLIFIRPLSSWLEHIEWDGKMVERFKLV